MSRTLAAFEEFSIPVAPAYQWVTIPADGAELVPPHSDPLRPFDIEQTEQHGPVLIAQPGQHGIARPLLDGGLYLKFAQLEISDLDAMNRFAGAYGWLTGQHRYAETITRSDGSRQYVEGERWSYWVAEILRMRCAIAARMDPSKGHSSRWHHIPEYAAILESEESAAAHKKAHGIYSPSTVERITNPQLTGMRARLTTMPDGSIRLGYQPDSLLTAMWLQFALATHAGAELRQCPTCHAHFEVGWKVASRRRHSKFCDNAQCKLIASRNRQRETIRLGREGRRSAAAIAADVGSTERQVRKWLRSENIQPRAPSKLATRHDQKARQPRRHHR